MMDRDILVKYGIDYDSGLGRCTGDTEFYEMLLSMFLQDKAFERAAGALEAGNHKALFESMHELKGVSGNAALVELYEAVCPLVELLRGGTDKMAEVESLFARVAVAHERTCEGISLGLSH